MKYADARQSLIRIKSTHTTEYLGVILRYRPRLLGSLVEVYDAESGVLKGVWLFADCPETYVRALGEAL